MTVQDMVQYLMTRNWSARDIESAIGHRTSVRSVYRWARGEREPKTRSTVEALRALVAEVQAGREA